ncbi:hypothetical protein OSB04_002673 [Centaurea solstitialis]|uniref:Uncharacterized protein n=1 Tax=Centaurea solstitialis TaxID=347529 RepID=A0AA38WN06_9ASTR|nr:hypothetical protein OSB04_002673 [Centaurea solstitialis]
MELDETDPTIWLKLEAATNDYIHRNSAAFKNLSEKLLQNHNDEKLPVNLHSQQSCKAKLPNTGMTAKLFSATRENGPSLGWRRNVLLVKASNSPDPRRNVNHVHSLERFCFGTGIKISLVDVTSGTLKPVPGTSFPSPFSSPLLSGTFPFSTGKTDLIPHLSLDGNHTAKNPSPPESPTAPRKLSMPIRLLHEKLQTSPQVGVVHLALQNDTSGSIIRSKNPFSKHKNASKSMRSWQNDVYVIAEPSELADKFLQNVKYNFLSMLKGRRRRYMSEISNISTVADLVARRPCFQIGVVVHRYIGRQTQVIEDDQEIAAYMFHRTVPFMHLSPADVRWMVGGWRDRIIIYTGLYGPSPPLIKAFLDSGAKAVICPSADPHETQSTSSHGPCGLNEPKKAKFEIGVDEVEDEDVGAMSPTSDWEEIETTPGADGGMLIWDDDDEEDLAKFICQLYDSIHLGGARVDVALQHALAAHRKMRLYACGTPHLPYILLGCGTFPTTIREARTDLMWCTRWYLPLYYLSGEG